jgi:ferric-dicitrate binding protein FerR (iron transport regulator)
MPDKRTVQLEGEALFEIRRDASRPFVVQVHNVTMTVLGTSFNVRSYPESNYIATTLIEGSLRVEAGKNAYTLLPGKQSRIHKISQENQIREVNTENVTGWIDGKLHFQLTPLSEMVAILERAFSVNIHVKNSPLLQKSFTGKFEHGESLEQIMEVLNLSMSGVSTYNKETNTIVIH